MAACAIPAPDRTARRVFLAAMVALVVGVSVQYSAKVLSPRADGFTRGAINRWANQLQDMEGGENIHAKYNYPNPPVMAQLLWPVSELATASPLAGALAWFYLKIGMALVCFLWAFKIVETPAFRVPVWGKLLAVALAARPILGDLTHGNINVFILFLVTGCLFAFSRGKDLLAGILLGLAIACKATPALFLVYFLWKRSFRVLLGSAVGLALFFLVVPSLFFAVQDRSLVGGWGRNWASLTAWFNGMVVPYLVHGVVTPERENQSLPGVLTRLLTASPSVSIHVDGIATPLAYHNVAALSAGTVKMIVEGCQVLFLVAMAWLCRTPVRPTVWAPAPARCGPAVAAEFSFVLIGMLLFSERTWKHHCVMLLLPMVALVAAVCSSAVRRPLRLWLGAALGVAVLMISATSSGLVGEDAPKASSQLSGLALVVGPLAYTGAVESDMTTKLGFVLDSPGKIAQVYGIYTAAFVILLVGLGVLIRNRRAFVTVSPPAPGTGTADTSPPAVRRRGWPRQPALTDEPVVNS